MFSIVEGQETVSIHRLTLFLLISNVRAAKVSRINNATRYLYIYVSLRSVTSNMKASSLRAGDEEPRSCDSGNVNDAVDT